MEFMTRPKEGMVKPRFLQATQNRGSIIHISSLNLYSTEKTQ